MPIVFTKEEVRDFLQEQGFDVSDEDTLRKFIQDLKKLIKFEDIQRRRRKLGHHPNETILDSTDGRNQTMDSSSSPRDQTINNRRQVPEDGSGYPSNVDPSSIRNRSESYYDEDEVDNLPGKVNGRERPPSATTKYEESDVKPPLTRPNTSKAENKRPAAKKPNNRLIMKRVTAAVDEHGESVIEESDIDLGIPKRPPGTFSRNNPPGRPRTAPPPKETAGRPNTAGVGKPQSRPTSARDTKRSNAQTQQQGNGSPPEEDLNADALFIALRSMLFPHDLRDSQDSVFAEDSKPRKLIKPPPHVARDPVSLYHWYKTYYWDYCSIPGEDRHMQLRWNVRAKTVGYRPCVKGLPVQCIKPKL